MTLIEIMIVLIILGSLLAVLGGNVMDRLAKSKIANTKIRISEITKGLDTFYLDCNFVPSTEQGLDALVNKPANCSNWGPKAYIKKNNLKDEWAHDFIYEKNGSTEYVVTSMGPDGEEGTEDDISNLEEETTSEEDSE